MKAFTNRARLNSGWRRRAGYDAALILTERSNPEPLPIVPAERKEWRPVIRVSENIVRRPAEGR